LPAAAELVGAQLSLANVVSDRSRVDVEDLGDLGRGQELAADQLLLERGDATAPFALCRVEVLQKGLETLVHAHPPRFSANSTQSSVVWCSLPHIVRWPVGPERSVGRRRRVDGRSTTPV